MATQDTVLCPCEGVRRAAVKNAVAAGAQSVDDVRRLTRAGMGACQGRVCESLLNDELMAAGKPPSFLRARPPLRAIPLSELAKRADSCASPQPEEPDHRFFRKDAGTDEGASS